MNHISNNRTFLHEWDIIHFNEFFTKPLYKTLELKNKCSYNVIEVKNLHPLQQHTITLSPNDKHALELIAKELLQTTPKEQILENLAIYKNKQKNKTAAH